MDKTCSIAFVDGMLINWTFHRDGFNGHISSEEIKDRAVESSCHFKFSGLWTFHWDIKAGWWFQIFFIFNPIWGRFPF